MKYFKYFAWLLTGISVIVIIVFFSNTMKHLELYLIWSYILLGVAILAAVGLPLIYMIQNPQMLKKTVLFVGLLGIVIALAYVLASSSPVDVKDANPTPAQLKFTDTGIISMYILLIVAVLSIFAGGVINMIRNR